MSGPQSSQARRADLGSCLTVISEVQQGQMPREKGDSLGGGAAHGARRGRRRARAGKGWASSAACWGSWGCAGLRREASQRGQ